MILSSSQELLVLIFTFCALRSMWAEQLRALFSLISFFFSLWLWQQVKSPPPPLSPSRDMWATLCFSSLQRLPSLLWMPVAGVNNKAVTWGAAAAALQHLWERLRSSYGRWTLLRLEGSRSVPPNPWGCFSSLCLCVCVCVCWSLSCNSGNFGF